MSLVSNALQTANAIIATARGEVLSYRPTQGTGSFTPLPGFVLDRDEPPPPQFQALQGAQAYEQFGRVVGPLTPLLAINNEIQDGSGHFWAVLRVDPDQQQILVVGRTTVDRAGLDRGNAS